MTDPAPDPDRLADARARAAFSAEHSPRRSNLDGERVLALDVLAEFVEDIYDGPGEQIGWALLYTERQAGLAPHEVRLCEDAWTKIHENADRAEWERLGLRR